MSARKERGNLKLHKISTLMQSNTCYIIKISALLYHKITQNHSIYILVSSACNGCFNCFPSNRLT